MAFRENVQMHFLYMSLNRIWGPYTMREQKQENPHNKIHGFFSSRNHGIAHPLLFPLKSPAMRESQAGFHSQTPAE